MKNIKHLLWILLLGFFVYYLLPEFANGMSQNDADNFAVMCVILFNSVYAILSGILLTKFNGFKWYYSVIIGIYFIPAVLLNYNSSTIIYSILYMLEYMIGSSIYIRYFSK